MTRAKSVCGSWWLYPCVCMYVMSSCVLGGSWLWLSRGRCPLQQIHHDQDMTAQTQTLFTYSEVMLEVRKDKVGTLLPRYIPKYTSIIQHLKTQFSISTSVQKNLIIRINIHDSKTKHIIIFNKSLTSWHFESSELENILCNILTA